MKLKKIFDKEYYELTGCIHNHSEYSFDSEISLKKIIKAAQKNSLDYITINDHSTKAAAKDPALLKESEVRVIVGCEINDKEKNNHLLVFNSDTVIKHEEAEVYSKKYQEEGATTFVAHPFEKRSCKKYRKYLWTNLENTNFDGLEGWNFLSCWLGKLIPKLNGLPMVLFPSLYVTKPHREILNYWDDLTMKGERKSLIGSVDAHGESIKKFGKVFTFLTHNTLFKTIHTNILLPADSVMNQDNIIKALKKGNSYLVNYKKGIPYNFYAGISNGEISCTFGEEIKFGEGLNYYFRLPKIARVDLYRNGKRIARARVENGLFKISKPGVYRLEIIRNGYGWIYTNNIFVV